MLLHYVITFFIDCGTQSLSLMAFYKDQQRLCDYLTTSCITWALFSHIGYQALIYSNYVAHCIVCEIYSPLIMYATSITSIHSNIKVLCTCTYACTYACVKHVIIYHHLLRAY